MKPVDKPMMVKVHNVYKNSIPTLFEEQIIKIYLLDECTRELSSDRAYLNCLISSVINITKVSPTEIKYAVDSLCKKGFMFRPEDDETIELTVYGKNWVRTYLPDHEKVIRYINWLNNQSGHILNIIQNDDEEFKRWFNEHGEV